MPETKEMEKAGWASVLFPFKIRAPEAIKRVCFDIDLRKRDAKIFDLTEQIKREVEMLLTPIEAYFLYSIARKTGKIEGDIAEVGVYKGGSAKLIYEATESKSIHLFDTFEGLPKLSEYDVPEQFHKGSYPALYDEVKGYLKEYPRISIHKGLFSDTANWVKDKRFSFVHLDVDIYESTLDCLNFFYPRMSKGGVIISHDYTGAKGVRKAFDDFFKDKLEIIIEILWVDQCMIIKT